jgi:hypothetical protein
MVAAGFIMRLRRKDERTSIAVSLGGLELEVDRPLDEALEVLTSARFDEWMECGDDRLVEEIIVE